VADRKKDTSPTTPGRDGYTGEDRRLAAVPDRRAVRRGGRRAGDVSKNVAKFIHQLLTEPPR
jgi:hypothetical protein